MPGCSRLRFRLVIAERVEIFVGVLIHDSLFKVVNHLQRFGLLFVKPLADDCRSGFIFLRGVVFPGLPLLGLSELYHLLKLRAEKLLCLNVRDARPSANLGLASVCVQLGCREVFAALQKLLRVVQQRVV